MSNKRKGSLFYSAAMIVLIYGSVAMTGHGMKWAEVMSLTVWAVVYGALMAGSAHHDAKAERG